MFDLELMKARVLEIADPNNPYSQEDFNKEFGKAGLGVSVSNPDFYKIKFGFANKSNNQDPEYATAGSSGFDLRASLDAPVSLLVGKTTIVPTGLYFEIPDNFEIQIRPRSGLAAKNGVTVLNTPGTIDADYRGEIKVILINHGKEDFVINNGDRIAQAVIASVIAKNVVKLIKLDNVSDKTERGSGGFGSTGTK
jgi:dUTP pyrophosphatase